MSCAVSSSLPPCQDFYARARTNMIESQLRPNGVLDEKLLSVMGTLPRESFVADERREFAYMDEDISMGQGRRMLAPLTVARLIQDMGIVPSARVLVVGAGTGYGAAVLNEIAGEVVALESDPALARRLQQNRQDMQLDNVVVVSGALVDGHAACAPYQGILMEGGIQWLPEKIGHQLAEGGRLACVVYPEDNTFGRLGRCVVYERRHGALVERFIMDAAAPLLPGFAVRPHFSFKG